MDYSLIAQKMRDRGIEVNASELCTMVRNIARDESIPVWTRDEWEKILGKFYQCETLYEPNPILPALDEENELRITFNHQVRGHDISNAFRDAICKQILTAIQSGSALDITQQHFFRICKMPVIDQANEADKSGGGEARLMQEAREADELLSPLAGRITVERIFCFMEQVVCVCRVCKRDLLSIQNILQEWVQKILEKKNDMVKLNTYNSFEVTSN